jgi:hypothetical protein
MKLKTAAWILRLDPIKKGGLPYYYYPIATQGRLFILSKLLSLGER